MVFGDGLSPAGTVAPAEWIAPACVGAADTVGALVPDRYASLLRVDAPAPGTDDWWSQYRELFRVIASVGRRHTADPDRAWFAVWEGHGFDTATTHIAHRGPLDAEAERELDRRRAALRDEDRRRNAAIRAALARCLRFEVPHRGYYLLHGHVDAVTSLRYPGFEGWRNPDAFWPDDRRWFVATDVDFWSLYVGGDSAFTDELVGAVPTGSERVTLDHRLVIED